MYNGFWCKTLHQDKLTSLLGAKSGVKQQYILSPSIFLVVIGELMRRTTQRKRRGINWRITDQLGNIDFAD